MGTQRFTANIKTRCHTEIKEAFEVLAARRGSLSASDLQREAHVKFVLGEIKNLPAGLARKIKAKYQEMAI